MGSGRVLVGTFLATVVAALALAGGATAKAPATTDAVVWDLGPISTSRVLIFGGLLSDRPKCVRNRRYKFVFRYVGGGSTVVDRGRSSNEGAWSVSFREGDVIGAVDRAVLVIAKSKGCARAAVVPIA